MPNYKLQESVTLNLDQMTALCNQIKDIVTIGLHREGYLEESDSIEICETIAIVVQRRNWFGSMMDRIFGKPEKDKMKYRMVRMIDVDNARATEEEVIEDSSVYPEPLEQAPSPPETLPPANADDKFKNI